MKALVAHGVTIPGQYTQIDTGAIEYLELVRHYGQKYMFGQQGNIKSFEAQIKSEIDETLRVIGLKKGLKKDHHRLPPWDYIRSTAVCHNKGIQWQITRAKQVLYKQFETWLDQAKLIKPPRAAASPMVVKKAFLKMIQTGFTVMETDKNLGLVALKQSLAMELYQDYTQDKRSVGKAALVKSKQLKRLEEERLAMLTCLRMTAVTTKNEWLEEAVKTVERGMVRQSNLPRLRLLIKVHKIKAAGKIPTRPIVPASTAPAGIIGMIAGKILGNVQTAIPWICKNTEHFIEWLSDEYRGEVKTFDFTNLFGNEKVIDTVAHLGWAIRYRPQWFENGKQAEVTKAFLVEIPIPGWLGWVFPHRTKAALLEIMVAYVIRETIFLAPTKEGPQIFLTTECLAMGAAPVCPVSNIVLAVMEARKHGDDICEKAIRRFVDDIAMDSSLLHSNELRSAYPAYLTLNDAEEGTFLDLNFRQWKGKRCTRHVAYWPHLKNPIPSLPHYSTAHRYATKKAMLKNELGRMARRCSHREFYPYYRDVVLKRFKKAQYPGSMINQYTSYSWEQAKAVTEKCGIRGRMLNTVNHIAKMYWNPPPIAAIFNKAFEEYDVRTAWKANARIAQLPRKYWSYMAGEYPGIEFANLFDTTNKTSAHEHEREEEFDAELTD